MAGNWMKSPDATSTYGGPRVIPFAQQTLAGMDQLSGTAQNAMGAMQNPLQSYAGMYNILNPIAQGDFSNDSTFNNTLGAAQEAARSSVDLSTSGIGRYGSGTHQATMAKSVGDLTNQAMLDRQNWALGGLQGIGDRMAGAYANAQAPAQTFMNLGSMQEDMAGKYAQAQQDMFNEKKMAPINAAAAGNAIFGGAGQLDGGSASGKVSTPGTPFAQQAIGFGTAAAGAGAGK